MTSSVFPLKNPVLRTQRMNLPPMGRGRVAHGLTRAAALSDHLELQVCEECGTVQYPPRDACGKCLSPELEWRKQSPCGELLSVATLHHSNHLYFRERLPWRIGVVRLDSGATVIAFLTDSVAPPTGLAGSERTRVQVLLRLDRAGQAVLVAQPIEELNIDAKDKLQMETGCSPRGRKILVTDGKTAVGQAIVLALLEAGAETVWAGYSEPWKRSSELARLKDIPGVVPVPLDLTDARSVSALGAELGGKVDIVVSNAEVHRTEGISSRPGTDVARAEMEVNYFGLLRLAQAFAPALKGRAADGPGHAVAWVNLLSVFALSNFPSQATYSASKAAALSLAQCLRAEMLPHGIRVLNVFPGPIDDEWNQNVPPPKLSPGALAGAMVRALTDGLEDLYPGDVAREWLARWRDNPKALERELVLGGL
ncbi:SDR family NAD(P)-dependent oxidoreductase [Variovorax atrisoli]|uniref:SDR family NAD(P)-dependent oxidoreductase n=1 Tax=Variovorax atrisoli TaxID=3394203 RepID=UPI00404034F4